MKRDTKRRSPCHKQQEKLLLDRLSDALSAEEMHRVLATAVLVLDDAGRRRLYRQVGEETAAVLRTLLAKGPAEKRTPALTPSAGRIREHWANLWSKWDAVVLESATENGQYIVQEHHWEQPYLDVSSLAGDLEPIAAEMRKLIPKTIDLGLEPGLGAADVLRNLDEEVGAGLPEWFDRPDQDCDLGPELTCCIFEWERLTSSGERGQTFALVDRVRRAEAGATRFGLDGNAVTDFVLGLDEAGQREILAGIETHRQEEHWVEDLESPYSTWFRIRHALAGRWQPELFEHISRENVARDWTLAPPLVARLLRRRRHEEALPIIDIAMTSYLQLRDGGRWDPCASLFAATHRFRYGNSDKDALRLLESWRKISSALGREEERRALDLQIAIARRWSDGDAVLAAIANIPERFAPLGKRLFAQWRELVVHETLGPPQADNPSGATWVGGLVDAATEGSAPLFRNAVKGWLGELERNRNVLAASVVALATLTADVSDGHLARRAPALSRALGRAAEKNDALQAWRRSAAARLGGAEVWDVVMDFWKRNVANVVPDPGSNVGADYSGCADWLAAVHELDVSAYRRLVADWTARHRLRRNLWRDIDARKLPRDAPMQSAR